MGVNGEESSAGCVELDKRFPEQDLKKEEDVGCCEEGQVKEEKKTSDAILDDLFSTIRESGAVVDVAEVITEVSRSRRERATREKSRSRSRSRDRKHKHKKNKKEKKPKKHRSRSRSNDRKRRHRSHSSSPARIGKTGTLADIRIHTKTKNLDDLKNTVPVTSTLTHDDDDDDDLPVGADYRTVMDQAIASSEPSTSQGPSLADLPTAVKMQPAFPLKKSDGERGEKKDAIEEKSSPMLKKVISEKGGAFLVPRKIQMDASKNNGNAADSFGPALPPSTNDEPMDEEEEVEMTSPLTAKTTPKISFGQISLKVNGGVEKKKEGNGVKKDDEKMDVDENEEKEKVNPKEKEDEKNEDKEKKAAKKMAVRRRRSASVEESKKKEKKEKEKERKRSRSRSKDRRDRDRDRSRDKGRDSRRDGGRSNERVNRRDDRRDDRRRRSRSRSAERRRDDRDRDRERRGRRSRSREQRRSRSRERSKSREKIDKKKLLEIALQNAKGVSGPVAEKQGVNMKILEKAGGRNIGDIVSYCQKLSETENAEKKTGGGRADSDEDDFSYKSKKEIKMNIPGSKQLPTSTPQERLLDTAPLRAAFPVSSGVIHRDNTKESIAEWKKVDPSSAVPSVCTPVQKKLVATSSLNKIKAESEGRSIPMSAFPILPPPPAPPNLRGDLIPPPPVPPVFNPASLMPPPPMPPTIITPSYDRLIQMPDSGYDEDSRSVGRRMEERSKVVNRLIRDPNDSDAMKQLSRIDDALNNFGKNAELSGKWMGHTRVNLLSGDELQPHDPRFHAWVKKDLFKNTMPVMAGVGMKLMMKMGWNEGEGLGRENQGDTQPLVLDVKSDRKGLYSEGYDMPLPKGKSKGAKKSGGMKAPGAASGGGGGGGLSEVKNPISAMMELAQAKKWELPVFDFQTRGGMAKSFICSVKVNGFEFNGPVCTSKKEAKTECARIALEKIGFAAPNVQTPMIYDPSSAYSIPEQIVQARVRSALEAASLSAMPPPSSYIAPLDMAAQPPDKYDPAQIQAMQREKDEEKAKEPQPVPPPPPPPPPKEKDEPSKREGGRGRGRGGRGRGGRGRGGGGGMDGGGYYPDGPYPPPHPMGGGPPPNGQFPPFPHHPGHWGGQPQWEEDFTQDPDGSSSFQYGEFPPQHGRPSYSSFPSGSFASRSSNTWTPDDEFRHPGGGPPSFHSGLPHRREHSPAFEPYGQPRYFQ